MNKLLVVWALCVLASTACGSGGQSLNSSPSRNDVTIGWATEARGAAGMVRAIHVGSNSSTSTITDAYKYARSVCNLAIAETPSDGIRRACETMGRAAATPRIDAAAIYEIALADFDAAGAKLSPQDLNESVRKSIELEIFDAQDPLSTAPMDKADWVPIAERFDFLCEYVFPQTVRAGECVNLRYELRGGLLPENGPYSPYVSKSWRVIRSVLFPDAPTPADQ
jgi:hypothetical protein